METATITAQKVHAVIKKAGVRKSETSQSSRVRGYWNTDYGYQVETNGDTKYICRYCGGDNVHKSSDCFSFEATRNTKSPWRQRKVKDGTFTVTLCQRNSIAKTGDDARTQRDRDAITAALTAAGIPFSQVDENNWLVG